MNIVLDTNVIVSALLNPHGTPAAVLTLVLQQETVLCYDNRIMVEYREVLSRARFGFKKARIRELLDYLGEIGVSCFAPPIRCENADPDDMPFAEVAAASGAAYLVTGNTNHYPKRIGSTRVVTPAAFVALRRDGLPGSTPAQSR